MHGHYTYFFSPLFSHVCIFFPQPYYCRVHQEAVHGFIILLDDLVVLVEFSLYVFLRITVTL
jgi:hypothetical protein